MSDNSTDDGTGEAGDDDSDAGAPVIELSELEEPVRSGFLSRLRRRIERRRLAGEVAAAGWHLPGIILLEFWNMLCQLVLPGEDRKGDAP